MGIVNKVAYVATAGVMLWVAMGPRSGPRNTPVEEETEIIGNGGPMSGGSPTAGSGSGSGSGTGTGAGSGISSGAGTGENSNLPPVPGNGNFDSGNALKTAGSDNASGGWCARGVANIAESQGLGNFRGIDAHDFPGRMASEGYVRLEGYTPGNAPTGSILTFNSDVRMGNPARNGGGGVYGHVEFVGTTASGNRTYISDAARSNYGGSVGNNFTGVWVKSN